MIQEVVGRQLLYIRKQFRKIRELVVTHRRIAVKLIGQLRSNRETKCPILYKDL